MEQTIRILIVENDTDYAWLLRQELERHRQLAVVGRCSGKEEAVEEAKRLNPDIVLMDLNAFWCMTICRTQVFLHISTEHTLRSAFLTGGGECLLPLVLLGLLRE